MKIAGVLHHPLFLGRVGHQQDVNGGLLIMRAVL